MLWLTESTLIIKDDAHTNSWKKYIQLAFFFLWFGFLRISLYGMHNTVCSLHLPFSDYSGRGREQIPMFFQLPTTHWVGTGSWQCIIYYTFITSFQFLHLSGHTAAAKQTNSEDALLDPLQPDGGLQGIIGCFTNRSQFIISLFLFAFKFTYEYCALYCLIQNYSEVRNASVREKTYSTGNTIVIKVAVFFKNKILQCNNCVLFLLTLIFHFTLIQKGQKLLI